MDWGDGRGWGEPAGTHPNLRLFALHFAGPTATMRVWRTNSRAHSIAQCGLRVNTVARFPRRGRGKVVQDCGPDPSRSQRPRPRTVALLCKDSAWLPPTEMVKLTTWDTSHGSGRAESYALFGGSWCSFTHQSNWYSPDSPARLCRGAGGAAPCVTSYKNKNTQSPVASSAAQPRYELGKRN